MSFPVIFIDNKYVDIGLVCKKVIKVKQRFSLHASQKVNRALPRSKVKKLVTCFVYTRAKKVDICLACTQVKKIDIGLVCN